MTSNNSLSGKRPVFVVGHPRSGTTLLQLLVTAHPAFSSAPETHFFSHVLENIPDWEHCLFQPDQLPDLFARLAGKPGIELDDAARAKITALAQTGELSAALFLDHVMAFYAPVPGLRWLEKTPRHVNFVPQILNLFPDARILNIVRDPRDVVSSNVRFQSLSPTEDRLQRRYICIQRSESWKTMVRFAQELQPKEPRMLTLRYEDLITDTAGNLERVMEFIGEQAQADALESFSNHYEAVVLRKEDVHKQLCAVGEIVDRRGIYKTRMNTEETQIVDSLCVDLMGDFGYITEQPLIPRQMMLEKARYELATELRKARSQVYQSSRRGARHMLKRLGLR